MLASRLAATRFGCRRRESAVICRARSTSPIRRKDHPSRPRRRSLLLEVIGTQEIRVRARCRIVQPGDDDFIDVVDETPLELDVGGPTADCTVRKLGDSGTIDVALRTADGRVVAAASTYTQHGAVRVRTIGPWGGASGFRLAKRFVFLKDMPDIIRPVSVRRSAIRRRRSAIPCRRSSIRRCRRHSVLGLCMQRKPR